MHKQSFTDVLKNRCSLKFRKIHRKTPVLESLFNEVAGLKAYNFINKRLQLRCFPVNIAHAIRSHLKFDLIEMYLLTKQRLKCICVLIGITTREFFRRELVKSGLTILKRNISPAKL